MNVEQLTIGEIAKVEELSGQSINALGDPSTPQGKVMAALVYVFKRRNDQSFKFEDAMNMQLSEIQEVLGLEDEDPKSNG